MVTCLVTGGAGFIGSHLVESLLARGDTVRVLDNYSTGTPANLARVVNAIELYPGQLTNLDFVRHAMSGVEVVYHLAPPLQSREVLTEPTAARFADALGLTHVLAAALGARVRRVVYASSLRVYGPSVDHPRHEEEELHPADSYAVAKTAEEQACGICTTIYGLETVRLRYFHVYGPRQPLGSLYATTVAGVLQTMLKGEEPVIRTDAAALEDLIYVDDAVHATILASEMPRLSGKVFNVGNGRAVTPWEVVSVLNSILGTEINPRASTWSEDGGGAHLANVSEAEKALGFGPTTDLEQGLRWCVQSATQRRMLRPPHWHHKGSVRHDEV